MSTPTRLLFISEGSLSHGGFARGLAASLDDSDEVDVRLAIIEEPQGLEALAIRKVPHVGDIDLQPLRWRLRYSWHARRSLRAGAATADVALINTQSCALLAAAVMRRLPTVLSVDCTGRQFAKLNFWGPPGRLSGFNSRPLELLERRAYATARAIVSWSEWSTRSLRDDYGVDHDRVVGLHPGVDLTRFAPGARVSDGAPLRVLFVGNGTHRKGLDVLLAARNAVQSEMSIDVVTQDAIPSSPGVAVHRGLAPGDAALYERFAGADLLVHPSRADAAPWVVVEALACGVPVVASDVGAVAELIGDTGVLVPAGDPRALAGAIQALAEAPERRIELATRARARAEAHFDRGRQAARLRELVRSLSYRPGDG